MPFFFLFVHNPSCFILPFTFTVCLSSSSYTLLCILWLSLSSTAPCTDCLLPSPLFLSLSLFQTTVIITLHTALRRGEHIRVNPFCLAALMFVAMLRWSINTQTYTRGSEKREPQMCFLNNDLFIPSFSAGLINMGQSSAVVIVFDLTC